MIFVGLLILLSQPLATSNDNIALQQQLAKVKALRLEELAELTAAAQVRKLQHELQVAELKVKINGLTPHRSQPIEPRENPLSHLQILGAIDIDASLRVWLQNADKTFLLGLDESGPNGLRLQLDGNNLRVIQGSWQRLLPLAGEW